MNQQVQKTYKSNDTEEWLDRVWTRPIGYLWAKFFERLGVHPNVVTVLSMIIGASAAIFFAHGSYRTEGTTGLVYNIIGVLLLAWANFYDSADGQLARMTGKKTQLGRILDGAASDVWFIPIYCALTWRFYLHHTMEFQWLGVADTSQNAILGAICMFIIALYSGFHCHAGQCALADYYRQIHLYFLNGKAGSELDNSAQQQQLYDETPWTGNVLWKTFLKTYVNYTKNQERRTPHFQQLMQCLHDKYGGVENIPQSFREEFRRFSLPIMPMTNILTFNTRAIALYLFCLLDIPWIYFIFEIVVMSALCGYMRHKHEALCGQLSQRIHNPAQATIA